MEWSEGRFGREDAIMGALFKFPAMGILIAGGIWGFFLSIEILQNWMGDILGFIVGVFLAPFLLSIAPLIEGLMNGYWLPAQVVYGSTIIGFGLIYIGSLIDGD